MASSNRSRDPRLLSQKSELASTIRCAVDPCEWPVASPTLRRQAFLCVGVAYESISGGGAAPTVCPPNDPGHRSSGGAKGRFLLLPVPSLSRVGPRAPLPEEGGNGEMGEGRRSSTWAPCTTRGICLVLTGSKSRAPAPLVLQGLRSWAWPPTR